MAPGVTQTQTRTTVYKYAFDATKVNYQLIEEVAQPVNPTASSLTYLTGYTLGADSVATMYTYDPTYGYRTSVTARGLNMTDRTTRTAMDFVNNTVTTTNALGHAEIQTLDPKFGVPVKLQGPNQIGTALSTQWFYDGFGRKVKELRADGTYTTIDIAACTSCGVSYASYSVTTTDYGTNSGQMSAPVKVYYDMLGRELRVESQGFNGTAVYKDTAYDTLGRVAKSSLNYFSNETARWTTPTYDTLGRVISVLGPDNSISKTVFAGLTTTATTPDAASSDGKTRTRKETKTVNGLVATVTDALEGVITYKYDAFGNLAQVITRGVDGKTSTITNTYDLRGRKNGETTLYLNPRWDVGVHFEKEFKKDGSLEYQHYIYAPGGAVAQVTVKVAGSVVTNTTRYLHKDHLGSVNVVTNETGAVVTRFRYDPFGKQQTVSGDPKVTHHGYTGHEMMNGVGLINMNGRVYDPSLGRFMQGDPTIQEPLDLQNYNRYSYVDNNPLSATDPSGYKKFWKQDWAKKGWMKVRGAVKVVAGAALLYFGWADPTGTAQRAGLSGIGSGACEMGWTCQIKSALQKSKLYIGGDKDNYASKPFSG